MTKEDFDNIFEAVGKTEKDIPAPVVLAILANIVKSASDKNNDAIVELTNALKDDEIPDIIFKSILFVCNSIIIGLWKLINEEEPDIKKNKKADA